MSLVAVALVGAAVSCFAGGKVELVPISEVKISDTSVFAPAVKADVAYVLALDPDRLLAPFRREAGLPAKAKSYGNWESCGLDGHTLGHYLSALAGLIASGADADGELKRRLDYIVDELAVCQSASGDGRLDGVPNGNGCWNAIRSGNVEPIFKYWVPWYNVHKTFADPGEQQRCRYPHRTDQHSDKISPKHRLGVSPKTLYARLQILHVPE